MDRNNARLQMLALALLGFFAVLCLPLEPVQAVMDEYLPDTPDEAVAEQPAVAPRPVEGPTLAAGSERRPPSSPCCEGPQVIAVDDRDAAMAKAREILKEHLEAHGSAARPWIHVTKAGALDGKPIKVPAITSMWRTDGRPFWSSLSQASEALELSDAQRDTWTQTIEDARHELEALHEVPKGYEAAYAAKRARILRSYRERLRADLTAEQQVVFDKHAIAPLMDVRAAAIAYVRFAKSTKA